MRKAIDVTKYKNIIFLITALLLALSLTVIATIPFNQSIEFKGGSVLHIQIHSDNSIESLSSLIPEAKISPTANPKKFIIHFSSPISSSTQKTINEYANIESSSTIAPSITGSLIRKSFLAVTYSTLAIFLYIFLRFNLYYSLGTMATILHDTIFVIAFIKICRIECNITTIAAILTVIGYSVNDTIIIYDKIRDSLTLKSNLLEKINSSITSTLPRTIGTSFSTAIAIVPVLFLTTGSIKDFCLIVIFGIAIGTISSVVISALILISFQKKLFEIIKLKNELKSA